MPIYQKNQSSFRVPADAKAKVAVGGFDLSPRIVDDIIAGKSLGTVDSGAYYEGYMPIVLLYYYAKYGIPPVSIAIGGTVIDKEAAAEVKKWAGTYR